MAGEARRPTAIVADGAATVSPVRARRRAIPGRPSGRWAREARAAAQVAGPLLVAALLLTLGYLHYAPGAHYSLSETAYRAYAFPAFRYSDIIWLYLRDGLAARPIPYLDYPLEYPPLTGLLSYALSFAPDLPTYFLLAYLVLAACALGTVETLRRLPGANPWLFAAAPALLFYPGTQWDVAAVFAGAVALLLYGRERDRAGTVALVAAVWLKFFPLVFLAPVLLERLRRRRWRAMAEIVSLFAVGSLVVNLPFALLDPEGWSFFFRWNRDRPADAGLWLLLPGLSTADVTSYSALAVATGGAVLLLLALRARQPVMLPLAATLLLWWIVVNKMFTNHLAIWVFLALALLGAPLWLWSGLVVTDVLAFQIGNFTNLPLVGTYQHRLLNEAAVDQLFDVVRLLRWALIVLAVAWGVRALAGRSRRATMPPSSGVPVGVPELGAGWSVPTVGIATPGNGRSEQPVVRARWRILGRRLPRPTLEGGVAIARRTAWPALVLAAYVGATVAMTWPYAARAKEATVVGFDPLLQIWLSRWVQHALTSDPLHLYDANIFHPLAQTLAYTDANIPGALLAAAVDAATGDAILTNSLLVLLSFVAAAAGVYAVVLRLSGNRGAAFLAGLAFAFVPFRMVHLWHLNWLQHAWLPWTLLAFLRFVDRPTVGRSVVLGLLIALPGLTSFYFTVQIALLLGPAALAAALAEPRLRTRRVLGRAAVAGGVAAALLVPLYLPYAQVRAEQGLERSLAEAEHYKARATSYLSLAPWDAPNPVWGRLGQRPSTNESLLTVGQATHADGHRHGEIVSEEALFPGTFVLLGAVVALVGWRRHRWLVPALAASAMLAILLSLGPSWGPSDGSGPRLPYRLLYDHAPFFAAMRVPARLGGLAALALSILAGLGAARAWEALRRRAPSRLGLRPAHVALTGAMAALILFELWAAPIPLEAVDRRPEVAAPYEWLAAQTDEGALMEFPAESIFVDPAAASVRRHVGLSMYWSTRHWRPLVNGNSGFIPTATVDLLDQFVGDLPRPDGSVAPGVSHVGPEHVGLLGQLGVRYLLFHRSQYRPGDWPAVEARLAAADGSIEKVGDFGEGSVYRVSPPAAGREPTLTLFAPTLSTPAAPWAPSVMGQKRTDGPALFSYTRPAVLETFWYDAAGRELHRERRRPPLPTILTADRLLCTTTACQATAQLAAPAELPSPAPEDGVWRPTAPGRYAARLVLSGDHPIDCTIDVEIVEDEPEVRRRSPDDPHRWAECVPDARQPVNDPSGAPFDNLSSSVNFDGGALVVETTLVARRDEEVQAWFLLAPPDAAAPWQQARYRSPTRHHLLRAGEPSRITWSEALPPDLSPGVYELSVWFHRRVGAGWEHAHGDDFDLPSIVVEADGTLHWSGPYHLARTDPFPRLLPDVAYELPLRVSGASSAEGCAWSWRLRAPGDGRVVAAGHGAACGEPWLRLPEGVAAGRYDLEITALTVRGTARRVSDGLSAPVVVVGREPRERPS